MALTLLSANNASTVLSAGISASATTLTVNTGTGGLFPSPVSGTSFFKLTLIDAATGTLTEIVHVTARTGDIMTIVRGQEGTTNRLWSANDIAANMMTAGTLDLFAQSGSLGGAASLNVGTTAGTVAAGNDSRITGAAQFTQLTGVIGTSRNAKMSVTAASSTATFTADELIVQTALGGLQYKLSSFSKTINLATTGVGGMDTGTVPANGFVALYAIYNPTTQISALLAVNASSVVAPEVYGGSNMPAGYMASALVSVLPTSSSQLAPVIQQGRRVSIVGASILSGSGAPSSLAALAITEIPLNTTLIRMSATVGIIANDTTGVLEVAASAALVGAKRISLGASGTGGTLSTTSYMEMPVADNSRNIYWRVQSANISYGLTTMGYEF
ncbi:tail fiber protein [Yersinia phage vB_YenM_210.17]|nr:tail fiber protein [Yersinia phage vB_YenM_210.17]